MAITVVLRDANRADLLAAALPYRQLVTWSQRFEFPMLDHIDPYGDTIFNGGQMQSLVAELDAIETGMPDVGQREARVIAQIRELCAAGIRRPHSFLWFVGD